MRTLNQNNHRYHLGTLSENESHSGYSAENFSASSEATENGGLQTSADPPIPRTLRNAHRCQGGMTLKTQPSTLSKLQTLVGRSRAVSAVGTGTLFALVLLIALGKD
jgi:hypothetical protein